MIRPRPRQAYSHEVTSFGFWPGDRDVRDPTFYSYTAPEPPGLTHQPPVPASASDRSKETLLDFLQSAYGAGVRTAGWDAEALRTSAAPEPEPGG